MEVQVISEEFIKPSSPTPHHLRNYRLSLLDQLFPAPYAPMVFFYPVNKVSPAAHGDSHITNRLEHLKRSLSDTLVQFYPLAGMIKDDFSIDCNDEGAYFVEASVTCPLHEFLSHPDVLLVHKFLPCESTLKTSSAGSFVGNIQVTVFKCGALAIGLCISHKILDGAGLSSFMNSWASVACGPSEPTSLDFTSAASLFPADDLWLRDSSMVMWGKMFKKGKSITKRFVFDASSIKKLKAKAMSPCGKSPTRVEAVSASIWKSAMAACEQVNGFSRPSKLTHAVNLRKRTGLPLSDCVLGNLVWIAKAQSPLANRQELSSLVEEIRRGISKIDRSFVEKLKGNDVRSVLSDSLKEISKEVEVGEDYFAFTSLSKVGFYAADFGWGMPVWVSSIGQNSPVFFSFILLMETRSGEGIEAWVTLDEKEMNILEQDAELRIFARVDPSPLEVESLVIRSHL